MEKPVIMPLSTTPAIRYVERPQSAMSTVTNGVLNGATIGGGAFIIPNVVKKFIDHNSVTSQNYYRATVLATVIGASIGTYYSFKEAKQLSAFRTALAKDIETLHAQVDSIDPTISR